MKQDITASTASESPFNAANELCVTESTTPLPTCATSGTTYAYDSVGNLTGSTPAGWASTLTTDNDQTTKVATTPAGTLSSQQYIGAIQDQRVTGGQNHLNGAILNGVPTVDGDQDTAGTGNRRERFSRSRITTRTEWALPCWRFQPRIGWSIVVDPGRRGASGERRMA